MPKTRKPLLVPRKAPRQARSASLVSDILVAAVRVLAREGAPGFTTVRVAKEAGVSVGSLYQYFPNKEALLFRLQADEWSETWSRLEAILADTRESPGDRLRRAVVTFFHSERAEAELRVALDDAGALFRDAPEARALRAKATHRIDAFMEEALPSSTPEARAFAADYVFTSLSAVAEKVTAQRRSRAEIDAWAETTANLFCLLLGHMGLPPSRGA